jgi:uncharacterized membrane protein
MDFTIYLSIVSAYLIAAITDTQFVVPEAMAVSSPLLFVPGGVLCLVFMWHVRRSRER